MNDYITLSCPSCGVKLEVVTNTSILLCQHCGTEHIVRRQGDAISLESFVRCPKCGRNDRVENVSSILKSHTQEIIRTEKRTETYIDKDGIRKTRTKEIPVTQTQVTGLARILKPPQKPFLQPKPEQLPKPNSTPKPNTLPKPELKSKPIIKKPFTKKSISKVILIIISALIIIPSFVMSIVGITMTIGEPALDNLLCASSFIIILVIGIVILVYGIRKKPLEKSRYEQWQQEKDTVLNDWEEDNSRIIKNWQEENEQRLKEWQIENERRLQEWEDKYQQKIEKWQKSNARIRESWEHAMDNWNNLYFCHRDDCVFVPGKGTYAPIEEYDKYLYE